MNNDVVAQKIDGIKQACPGASDVFILRQLCAGASPEQARDAFIEFQAAEIRRLDGELVKAKAAATPTAQPRLRKPGVPDSST